MSVRIPKRYQATASLPGKLKTTVNFDMAFYLLKVKFKVEGRGTGYRPETVSARIPKWCQVTACLPGQLTKLGPGICNPRSNPRSNDGVPDMSRNYVGTFMKMVSNENYPLEQHTQV